MDKDFELAALPDQGGLAGVKATPRAKDGAFQSLNIGFKGKELAAIDIQDSFGQHSRLDFSHMVSNPGLPDDAFVYTPPAGAEVIEQ
jgi:outer membrane lipoprotein carrier protein